MASQDIKEYVHQNVTRIIKTYDYRQKRKNTYEIKTIVDDTFDEVHFFITITEFFKLNQQELEKRWDTIKTVDELCNNIVDLMAQKRQR